MRIRNCKAVKVNVGGKWYYLGRNALTTFVKGGITVGDVCDDIVKKACNNSVYAHEKSLSSGYFTLEDGVRVGVCGEVFGKDGNVFQKYTSLCFRIPHSVNCVSERLYTQIEGKNTVVIGPPGSGKTTFLRDLAHKLSNEHNILVADERGELFYDNDLQNSSNCDVLKYASKRYAFEVGLRSMSPDYVVCDELAPSDGDLVMSCALSGVKIICSAHGNDCDDFSKRFDLADYFDIAVVLGQGKSPLVCVFET
ncbi:MAG: hypothetical protein NC332_04085 [Firmicutes bacterium]|nr:hypothetical protein [Bacillota bacterium]